MVEDCCANSAGGAGKNEMHAADGLLPKLRQFVAGQSFRSALTVIKLYSYW